MQKSKITSKDPLIWRLLDDPNYKVTADGRILSRVRARGHIKKEWKRAGWISRARNGTQQYWRVTYKGERLYGHRIVWASHHGFLCAYRTINHKDLNGLNNDPPNLELISASANIRHAKELYRRTGMSGAEAKAKWIQGHRRGPVVGEMCS